MGRAFVSIIFDRSLAVALGRNRSCSKKTRVRMLLDVLQKFVDDLCDSSDVRVSVRHAAVF
jgi:hypothetical protein